MCRGAKLGPLHLFLLAVLLSGVPNFVTAAQLSSFAGSQEQVSELAWQPPNQECKQFISDLPRGWSWGIVANSGVRTFYYFKGRNPSELRRPVAILNGGPGRSSHSLPTLFGTTVDLDFIFMDQRGTGCSDPFPIVGLHDASLSRLQDWTTMKMVGDFEAVRRHLLGDRKWVIYGHSFGGRAAIRYLQLKPESLIGVHVSATGDVFGEPRSAIQAREEAFEALQMRFLDRQIVGPDGPESIRAALFALRRDLPSDMCFVFSDPYGNRLCGGEVLDALSLKIGFEMTWDYEAFRIEILRNKLREGNTFVIRGLLEQMAQEAGSKVEYRDLVGRGAIGFVDMLQGNFSSVLCKELNLPLRDYPISECRMFRNLARRTPQAMYADARRFLRPEPYLQKQIRSNVDRFKLSIHVYAGTLDPFAPASIVQRLARRLGSRTEFHLLQNADHGIAMKHPEVLENLRRSF